MENKEDNVWDIEFYKIFTKSHLNNSIIKALMCYLNIIKLEELQS